MRESRARQRARGPDGRPTPPVILAHSPARNAAAELQSKTVRPRGRCCVKRSLRSVGALARLHGSPRPPTSIGSCGPAGWSRLRRYSTPSRSRSASGDLSSSGTAKSPVALWTRSSPSCLMPGIIRCFKSARAVPSGDPDPQDHGEEPDVRVNSACARLGFGFRRLADEPGRHAGLVAEAPASRTQRSVPRKFRAGPAATRESGTPPPGRPSTGQAGGRSAARARNTRPDIAGRETKGGDEPTLLRQAASGRNTEGRARTMIWVRSPARPVAGRVRMLASRREARSGQPGVSGRQPGDAASAPPAAPSAPIPPAGQPAGPWRHAAPGEKPCPWRGRVPC